MNSTPNLDYFQARYFSAEQGRFTSPDPANAGADPMTPQSWNGYAYVLNNPLANVDPDGLDPIAVSCPGCTVTVDGGSPDSVYIDPSLFSWGQYGGGPMFYVDGYARPDPPPLVRTSTPPKNWKTDLVPANPCLYSGRALPATGYAAAGNAAKGSPVTFILDALKGFPRGDYLDAQPLGTGNVLQRAAYGNYAFGVYMAAAGIPLSAALAGANGFGFASGAKYGPRNGPTDPLYSSLPLANTINIEHGYSDQQNGMTCHN